MIVNQAKDKRNDTDVTIVVMSRDEAIQLACNLLEQVNYAPNAGRKEFFEAGQYFSVEVLSGNRTTTEVRKDLAREKRKRK